MVGTKLSVSMDGQLATQVRREARAARKKTSTWIADVVREHLRQKEARQLLTELDAQLGPPSAEHTKRTKDQWPED